MADYKWITECRICGSARLKKYLDLGKQPLANQLLSSKHHLSKKYPLQVLFCQECSLSQLSVVVEPTILYTNYPYHSSVSETFRKHCREMAKTINEINPFESKVIIDVASNDGCLLREFQEEGKFRWLIGYEPSQNLSEESIKNLSRIDFRKKTHIDIRNQFFNKETPIPHADVITATNVFAHVDNIKEFASLMESSLQKYNKSFCVVEVPYLFELLSKNQFDTIYHEHLSYFIFKPIKTLFNRFGLRIFRVDRMPIHGGSLRIYACPDFYKEEHYLDDPPPPKDGKKHYRNDLTIKEVDSNDIYPTEESVKDIEFFERTSGLYTFKLYSNFGRKVEDIRHHLKNLLKDLRSQDKKVMGYCASAKGSTLLNYCNIDTTYISAIVDETPQKQWKYMAGTGIPIVPFSHFESTDPDYIALLSWNFSEELMSKTRAHKAKGGKYIITTPRVSIL